MAHAPPGHHSVVGRPSAGGLNFPEYVVYRGEQAYPEYFITYQIVKPEDGAASSDAEVRLDDLFLPCFIIIKLLVYFYFNVFLLLVRQNWTTCNSKSIKFSVYAIHIRSICCKKTNYFCVLCVWRWFCAGGTCERWLAVAESVRGQRALLCGVIRGVLRCFVPAKPKCGCQG